MTKTLLLRRCPDPTDALYVTGPLHPLTVNGDISLRVVNTGKLGFRCLPGLASQLRNRHVIVSRYCPPPVLRRIRDLREELASLHYLVDDDIPAAADTPTLRADYRRQLAKVTVREFSILRDLADRFVVSSHWLQERFASSQPYVLNPVLIWDLPDLNHFDSDETFVCFHATAIHEADLAAIAPALVAVHEARPDVWIELITDGRIPPELRRLRRVLCRRWMPWAKYRQFVANSPRHVMVVPLMSTPFNRGKSNVKVLEAAGLGAVGVYSGRSPYSEVIEHGSNGILVDDAPDAWRDAILSVIGDRRRAREIAAEGQRVARRIGDPGPATAYWREALTHP